VVSRYELKQESPSFGPKKHCLGVCHRAIQVPANGVFDNNVGIFSGILASSVDSDDCRTRLDDCDRFVDFALRTKLPVAKDKVVYPLQIDLSF
jgi:hypothetical protein